MYLERYIHNNTINNFILFSTSTNSVHKDKAYSFYVLTNIPKKKLPLILFTSKLARAMKIYQLLFMQKTLTTI